jgi:hypothetical protein
MTNQNQIQIVAEINTLEAEGLALAKEWKSICSADKRRFNKATKADGFDTRLGKLMLKLKAESDAGRISSARLKECNIHSIDKRRRSEALWFVENETACRDFIQASKKGFTSLTALQSAMRKAEKSASNDEPLGSDGETESNVGPTESETQEQSEAKSAGDIALDALIQCETNGVSVKDFMLALKEQLEMLDQTQAVA